MKISETNTLELIERLLLYTLIGLIIIELPSTRSRLIILEPKILPITRLDSFLLIAIKDVANSGILVPRATIDKDITINGMPNDVAILIAPLINKSDPQPNKNIPINE